jgi:hypothetical protein
MKWLEVYILCLHLRYMVVEYIEIGRYMNCQTTGIVSSTNPLKGNIVPPTLH